MGYKLLFEESALDDIESIDKITMKRLLKKLEWFSVQKNPLEFAKSLRGMVSPCYRFRIGEYRIIFDIQNETILIRRIGHRSVVYRSF